MSLEKKNKLKKEHNNIIVFDNYHQCFFRGFFSIISFVFYLLFYYFSLFLLFLLLFIYIYIYIFIYIIIYFYLGYASANEAVYVIH